MTNENITPQAVDTAQSRETAEQRSTKPRRKLGRRDGLFQRNGWWWIDYVDAEGKRHREKAAPNYETARLKYRDKVTRIARGEILGVRDEGIRLRDFTETRYWSTVRPTLSVWEQERARAILNTQIFPASAGSDSLAFGVRRLSVGRGSAASRFPGRRPTKN